MSVKGILHQKLLIRCSEDKSAITELDSLLNTAPIPIQHRYLLDSEKLSRIIRKQWRQAEDVLLCSHTGTLNIAHIRSQLFDYLIAYNSSVVDRTKATIGHNIDLLNTAILRWAHFDDDILIKLTSTSRNESLIGYFHMYLEAKWFSLIIHYKCGNQSKCTHFLRDLIQDLITFLHAYYKKINVNNLVHTSPFICKCVHNFLQLLEQFSRTINVDLPSYFNETLKENGLFNLWLFRHIELLHEDGVLLEAALKTVNHQPDINYLIVMQLAEPALAASASPYQLFWEYFNKQLGNDCAPIPDSPVQFLQLRASRSSFHHFLAILAQFLQRNPAQWSRLRGRIYSKLPLHKFNELSECGLANVVLLFLQLAHGDRFGELTDKLLKSLEGLSAARRQTKLVFDAYLALILLHVDSGVSVEAVCKSMLPLIDEAADGKETFVLLNAIFNGIELLTGRRNFDLNQHCLLGVWLKRFLVNCHVTPDLYYALNVLCALVDEIDKCGEWLKWEPAFKTWLLPGLKQVSVNARTPPQVGALAAKICRNSNEALAFFTNEWIAPDVTASYLCTLLRTHTIVRNQENVIAQAWIRCCLVNSECAPDLTEHILKFERFRALKVDRCNYTNPLCDFVKSLNRAMGASEGARDLCDVCFAQTDTFVTNQVWTSSSEGVVLHMYTCFALLFFYCGPLLYRKQRSNCLLGRLVAALLLPSNRAPHPFVLKAVLRTWHLYIQGIFSIDDSDPHLDRIISDLTVLYFPHMKAADSPIIKCLYQEKLARLLLEKIGQTFLSVKTYDENSRKVFQLIQAALSDHFAVAVRNTIALILECIMGYRDKEQAVNLLRTIANSTFYDAQSRQWVQEAISKLTEKHLAFNASNYFQLIGILVRLVPGDIRIVLPAIKQQICVTEKMRGVGHDSALRQGCETIERLLTDF